MFKREITLKRNGKEYRYLHLVHNVRKGKKVRQKLLLSLGRVDKLNPQWVDQIVTELGDYTDKALVLKSIEEIHQRKAKSWGEILVLSRLWEDVGLSQIIQKRQRGRKFQFNLSAAVQALVFAQLLKQGSDLSAYEWLKEGPHFPAGESLKLHHFYRALDFLTAEKKAIENALVDQTRDLFNLDLDVVFYDTSLVNYQGQGPEDLVKYSRKKKRQFLVGLMMDRNGYPVASEVMAGNQTDVTTVRMMADKLSQRFKVKRCIFVGDRGMLSEDNLAYLREHNYRYVIGVPARKCKEARDIVLKRGGRYHQVKVNLWIKEVRVNEKRYIVCFNPGEKRRDEYRREELIQKLEAELKRLNPETKEAQKLLVHPVKSRYLKKLKNGKIRMVKKKIVEAARYDGRYVLVTNETELSNEEVAVTYRRLQRIEQSFRSLKSLEKMEPVYHRVERRVKGHVFVCVLAHLLERILEERLKQAEIKLSPSRALKKAEGLQANWLEVKGKPYLFRNEPNLVTKRLFKALQLRLPARIKEL